MRRLNLFEFSDLSWYPRVFRAIQTDYLLFVTARSAGHKRLIPLFKNALKNSPTPEIVDLCSGSGGPWLHFREQLKNAGLEVRVTLTDKYPSPEVTSHWFSTHPEGVVYYEKPVDARAVPDYFNGMRTLFEGFHHFKPADAFMILKDAYDKQLPIGIFEASLPWPQAPLIFLLSPIMTLLGYLFATPFIKPRKINRFMWTYLLPIVPLATCWDGLVSFLRGYSQRDLKKLIEPLAMDDYHFEIGELSTGVPIFNFTYLIGYPLRPVNVVQAEVE
jgi:hypothetical protein